MLLSSASALEPVPGIDILMESAEDIPTVRSTRAGTRRGRADAILALMGLILINSGGRISSWSRQFRAGFFKGFA
jgi:hypothetical protein